MHDYHYHAALNTTPRLHIFGDPAWRQLGWQVPLLCPAESSKVFLSIANANIWTIAPYLKSWPCQNATTLQQEQGWRLNIPVKRNLSWNQVFRCHSSTSDQQKPSANSQCNSIRCANGKKMGIQRVSAIFMWYFPGWPVSQLRDNSVIWKVAESWVPGIDTCRDLTFASYGPPTSPECRERHCKSWGPKWVKWHLGDWKLLRQRGHPARQIQLRLHLHWIFGH